MKYSFLLLLFFLFSCVPKNESTQDKATAKTPMEETRMNPIEATEWPFYVGTYTDGESKGIYKYTLDNKGVLTKIGLAVESNNPSFLAKSEDEKYLIAVNEINSEAGAGTVESYLIEGDHLKFISASSSGGAHPCHVSMNKKGEVLAANYTGGNVGYLKLDVDGKLSGLLDVQQHKGKGSTKRQEAPHAHSAWFIPHSDEIISVDLGTNQLWFSSIDPVLKNFRQSDPYQMTMAKGAGPRHLAFHRNGKWIYVVNELDCTVSLIKENDGGTREIGPSISTLPKDWKGDNTCADIHVSKDGKFLYASNRGHNSLAIFQIHKEDGSLTLQGHESVRGDGPRNFALSPNDAFVVVANQKTSNLIAFERNKSTGQLTFKSEIDAPTPVCILF